MFVSKHELLCQFLEVSRSGPTQKLCCNPFGHVSGQDFPECSTRWAHDRLPEGKKIQIPAGIWTWPDAGPWTYQDTLLTLLGVDACMKMHTCLKFLEIKVLLLHSSRTTGDFISGYENRFSQICAQTCASATAYG